MGIDIACLDFETRSARRRRRLSAYCQPWRRSIACITSSAPALEDLAESFPALLFALATGYGTAEQRERACACVEAGLPLKVAAEILALPLWLRRIPAQALTTTLPEIPLDAEFSVAVASRMPSEAQEAACWLGRIVHSLKVVGRDFALWIAKCPRLPATYAPEDDFHWLTAWAWHGAHPGTPGHALLRRPWSPGMSWKRARDEVGLWRKRIDLAASLGGGVRDAWFADGLALGLEFVALRSVEDFIAESTNMENCLDQYAPHLAYGRVRVFSVRRNGRSIANLELSLRSDDATMPVIAQLRGPRNRRVSTKVWQAAHAWLGSQRFKPLARQPITPASARGCLHRLWRPYMDALRAAGLRQRFEPRLFGSPPLPQRTDTPSGLRSAEATIAATPAGTRLRLGLACTADDQRSA